MAEAAGPWAEPNRYAVRIEERPGEWAVVILDPGGRPVQERTFRSDAETETFASTVRQHIRWLSPRTFRRYYRIPDLQQPDRPVDPRGG